MGRVEAVAEQVQEDAGNLLRHQLDRFEHRRVVVFQANIEPAVLGAGAVVGEVQCLVDQIVEIDLPALPADAARVLQHALDDVIGALPMLGNLFEVAGQHLEGFVDLGALVVVQRRNRRRGGLLQFVEQFDRQASEIVDEIERVFDLVGDPGGQLPKRGHLLRLDQAGLRRSQVAQRAGNQPRVFHRNNRLRRKILQQRNLLVGKRSDFLAIGGDIAKQDPILAKRHHQ